MTTSRLIERVFEWKWRTIYRLRQTARFFFPHRVYRWRTRMDVTDTTPGFFHGPYWNPPDLWRWVRGRP